MVVKTNGWGTLTGLRPIRGRSESVDKKMTWRVGPHFGDTGKIVKESTWAGQNTTGIQLVWRKRWGKREQGVVNRCSVIWEINFKSWLCLGWLDYSVSQYSHLLYGGSNCYDNKRRCCVWNTYHSDWQEIANENIHRAWLVTGSCPETEWELVARMSPFGILQTLYALDACQTVGLHIWVPKLSWRV